MPREIIRLVGVYNANGGVVGELAYVFGKLTGRAHCALCDLTHRGLTESTAWKACRAALPVPFVTMHLDERDPRVRAASEGRVPCVLADLGDALLVVLAPPQLEVLRGDAARLGDAIAEAIARAGYTYAT